MGRNNADFFHGSYHAFLVGDVVLPSSERMPAYATNSRKEAGRYGDVYRVEPLSVDNEYDTPAGTKNYESYKGFKVIGHG